MTAARHAAGAVVLPGRLLVEVARSLPEGSVTLEYRESERDVELTAGSSSFHLRTLPADDFPAPPSPEGEPVELPADALQATVARVARAASRDEARPVLNSFDAALYGVFVAHILPNIVAEILVMGSLWLATAIRIEASLSFIGLGVRPPTPTWGGMIREGFENILDSVSLSLFPSLAILLVVFSLNMLGDGLRDAIDPKLRGGER